MFHKSAFSMALSDLSSRHRARNFFADKPAAKSISANPVPGVTFSSGSSDLQSRSSLSEHSSSGQLNGDSTSAPDAERIREECKGDAVEFLYRYTERMYSIREFQESNPTAKGSRGRKVLDQRKQKIFACIFECKVAF